MKYINELKKQLSLEFNCRPEDFDSTENIVTLSEIHEGRRIYQPEKYLFHMATIGGNAVITADEQLHRFLREWCCGKTGHHLFERHNLLPLENELNKYGYALSDSYHMFLPQNEVTPKGDFSLKWYEGQAIHRFYGDERFPNAICDSFRPERPDTIVVCALIDGEIAGMAGCSEDAKGFQQIGIDVMPQFRSRGLGTFLVSTLKCEIEKRGDIPFYGTSLSNLHSWNIALNSGFRPAWVEIGCKKTERNNENA